jgi:hypothetical protein
MGETQARLATVSPRREIGVKSWLTTELNPPWWPFLPGNERVVRHVDTGDGAGGDRITDAEAAALAAQEDLEFPAATVAAIGTSRRDPGFHGRAARRAHGSGAGCPRQRSAVPGPAVGQVLTVRPLSRVSGLPIACRALLIVSVLTVASSKLAVISMCPRSRSTDTEMLPGPRERPNP